MRSEYVDRLINKPRPRNPGNTPVLVGFVIVTVGEVVNVRGPLEQIRNHEIDHVGVATMVLAHVEDEGISVRHKVHCRYDCGPADIRRRKRSELNVPNIVTEDFDFRKSTVLMLQHTTKPCLLSRAWLAVPSSRTGPLRKNEGIVLTRGDVDHG